ncbi:NADH dehydrogenase [ubiquinone] 1 alpha subcomplex assembly factor 3 [Macleaya cordata]|uniref:NADH dehydrogenase [ubiquinone] 1 alpha subcomplex assembly factor 3 n=1 Tax=Macleaya cordata TaxID=56857 RepID=A0A200Q186_MACCD|nr:NADH dehydrogenase [ubiquinone] 1 alpha subcomplex assembly factor 3 [Macleaya cordata]
MAARHRATSTLPYLMRNLRKESPKPIYRPLPSLRRAFSLYDQINLIDNVPEDQLRFQGYTDTGFTVNGVNYEGSVLCVGNLLLSWSPKRFSDITPDSLSIFQLVRPIPEILIIGCGRYVQHVDPELRRFIRSTGMKLEAIDSRNAASTFNILNEEGRIVAAAFLPYGVPGGGSVSHRISELLT